MAIFELKTFVDIYTAVAEELKVQIADTTTINRIKRGINTIYLNEVVPLKKWWWLRDDIELEFEPLLETGTVSVIEGSATVTLSSAPTDSRKGFLFSVDGQDEVYKIEAHIKNSTAIKLSTFYNTSTNPTAGYKIWSEFIVLPSTLRETFEIRHEFRREPLTAVGPQEFRRITATIPKREGRPYFYTTFDFVDPTSLPVTSTLGSVLSRSSIGYVRTLNFSASLPNTIIEGSRINVTGTGNTRYNIKEAIVSSVAGVTLTYTATTNLDENTAGSGATKVKIINQEKSSERFRALMLYPAIFDTRTLLHVDFIKTVRPLENDADEPAMPLEDRIILLYGALQRAWAMQRNTEEAQRNQALYNNKLESMTGKIEDSLDKPVLKVSKIYLRSKRTRRSLRENNDRREFPLD